MMDISQKVINILDKLAENPILLIYLTSMFVVSLALFVVYHAVKERKD